MNASPPGLESPTSPIHLSNISKEFQRNNLLNFTLAIVDVKDSPQDIIDTCDCY